MDQQKALIDHRRKRWSWGRRCLARLVRQFWSDATAVTSVEYAVMLALILGIILIAITLLGTNTKAMWTNNSTSLQGVGFGS
jgi:Flp pilus assembly pilin Flp